MEVVVWSRMHISEPWELTTIMGKDFSYHYVVEATNPIDPPPFYYVPSEEEERETRRRLNIPWMGTTT